MAPLTDAIRAITKREYHHIESADHTHWHKTMLSLAEEFGFDLRLCRPYRAKTKGKVGRFNGYLKGSFPVPLAAPLKSSSLKLDVVAANMHSAIVTPSQGFT